MLDLDVVRWLHLASIWVLPVLFAITLHEAAHGYVAWRLGDDTAYRLGRVTINPLKHIDPFGTILLPGLLILMRQPFVFGYAKPVPVRFDRLGSPRRDSVLVAVAGPLANLASALASALLIHGAARLPAPAASWALSTLSVSVQLNLVLAVFNMLPLPPLDGGRVVVGLLPRSLAPWLLQLERKGMLILIVLVLGLPALGAALRIDLDVLRWLLRGPVDLLRTMLLTLAGLR